MLHDRKIRAEIANGLHPAGRSHRRLVAILQAVDLGVDGVTKRLKRGSPRLQGEFAIERLSISRLISASLPPVPL